MEHRKTMTMIKIFFPQEYGKQQIEIAASFQCGCCRHNIKCGLCNKFDGFKPNDYELGNKICPKFEQEISLEVDGNVSREEAEFQKRNIDECLEFIKSKN